ncbi:hypothetical protein MTO96_011136 [Rhipicephalus appendiculatus]
MTTGYSEPSPPSRAILRGSRTCDYGHGDASSRTLETEEELLDRAWRRLLLRLFIVPWLLSDRVAELPRLRVLRARPP